MRTTNNKTTLEINRCIGPLPYYRPFGPHTVENTLLHGAFGQGTRRAKADFIFQVPHLELSQKHHFSDCGRKVDRGICLKVPWGRPSLD